MATLPVSRGQTGSHVTSHHGHVDSVTSRKAERKKKRKIKRKSKKETQFDVSKTKKARWQHFRSAGGGTGSHVIDDVTKSGKNETKPFTLRKRRNSRING